MLLMSKKASLKWVRGVKKLYKNDYYIKYKKHERLLK